MFSKLFGFLWAALTATSVSVSAYDVGCLYPEGADDDLFAMRNTVIWRHFGPSVAGMETPYVIHRAHEITMCQQMCVSFHAPGMLDPLTMKEKLFVVPEFGQNPYSMIMCMTQCVMHVDPIVTYQRLMQSYGFTTQKPGERPDIRTAVEKCELSGETNCMGECKDICGIVRGSDYDPYVMGHYLGVRVKDYFANDGWNRYGDMQYSRLSDEPVPCTGNCRDYQDTTGYAPRPDPRKFPQLTNDTKYECTGYCRRWQPLQEGDKDGNLVHQEFVAPHVGSQAHWYVRQPRLTLEDPMYDLYGQTLEVIDELKATSSDQYRKDMIFLMDDKGKVRKVIQDAVSEQFGETREISFQEYMLYIFGISTSEHDALIQAWQEKVHHDLVRPTTIIKNWDTDLLYTFGGDREASGPMQIEARDFEAFIRVMPHGEFPSGSSCLCTAYEEFTDIFLNDFYNRSITDFENSYDKKYSFVNMTDLREICGQSRIWGGMHYPEAVPAGEDACTGIGQLAVDFIAEIRNDAEIKNPYYIGDARPVCMMEME